MGHDRRLTDEELAARAVLAKDLAARYRDGEGLRELAAATRLSIARIRTLLTAVAGIDMRKPGCNLRHTSRRLVPTDPAERRALASRLAERYATGEGLAEVAAWSGWSTTTVRDLIVEAGGRMRRPGRPRGFQRGGSR